MRRAVLLVPTILMFSVCGFEHHSSESGKNSQLLGLGNADLIEPQEDGTFKVHCTDGRIETVTNYHLLYNRFYKENGGVGDLGVKITHNNKEYCGSPSAKIPEGTYLLAKNFKDLAKELEKAK